MHEKYTEWAIKERIEYWYGQAIFYDRMQSSVTEGHDNIGLYFMNKWLKKKLEEHEIDWNNFVIKYCERFNIDPDIGKRLFELDSNDKEWIELAETLK